MKYFCQYANMLGTPGEGLHSIRIFNIAIIDVLFTFMLAYFIYKRTNIESKTNVSWFRNSHYWLTLGNVFILAIEFHWLFCVNTTINIMLFRYN
jgi:hypothetical protein